MVLDYGKLKLKLMQLKKINQDHYVVVTDEPIKIGDWVYNISSKTIFEAPKELIDLINSPNVELTTNKKITHSTQPLNTKFNDWFDVKMLDLSYIKSLVGEVDVEKKAEKEYPIYDGDLLGIAHNQKHSRIDFINGYNQCLEDNKGKGFTLSDIQNAWGIAYMNGHFKDAEDIDKISFVDFISSLTQPKDTWEVEFDENNNLKLK